MTSETWVGSPPERCQVCGSQLRDMFWDAEIGRCWDGKWAIICGDCFNHFQSLHGDNLGQAYNLATLERIEVPNVIQARRCHGCGRAIDKHAPERVVYCGRCGDVDGDDTSIGVCECEVCGVRAKLYATDGDGPDGYLELCRDCYDRRSP